MKRYCFDLDGTVYRGKMGIPTAVDFIQALQAQGNQPFYVNDNSSKTREQLQQALRDIGIEAPVSNIYSSALATAKYVAKHFAEAKVQVIGSDGIRAALELEGIQVLPHNLEADVFVMGIDVRLIISVLPKHVSPFSAVQKLLVRMKISDSQQRQYFTWKRFYCTTGGKCLRGGASIYWEAFTGHA